MNPQKTHLSLQLRSTSLSSAECRLFVYPSSLSLTVQVPSDCSHCSALKTQTDSVRNWLVNKMDHLAPKEADNSLWKEPRPEPELTEWMLDFVRWPQTWLQINIKTSEQKLLDLFISPVSLLCFGAAPSDFLSLLFLLLCRTDSSSVLDDHPDELWPQRKPLSQTTHR